MKKIYIINNKHEEGIFMEKRSYELKGDVSIVSKVNGFTYVIEGFATDKSLFYRTIGLEDLCGLDLEINLSLHPLEAKRILDCICGNILTGCKLEDGLITSSLTYAPVLIQKRVARYPKKENEVCYRIIFSDEQYLLPTDERCQSPYKEQLD